MHAHTDLHISALSTWERKTKRAALLGSARDSRRRIPRLFIPWDSDLVLSFPELKGLGADFTFGFIQVMDGEKDPRNLLVAFRIVHDLISKDYSLGMFFVVAISWLKLVRQNERKSTLFFLCFYRTFCGGVI